MNLPGSHSSLYRAKEWRRLRYTSGGSVTDRTTWLVSLVGEPLRLVPNA